MGAVSLLSRGASGLTAYTRPSQRISVIIPARNAGSTIKRSVKSTLRALGPDDEILVGLHNCSDGSEAQVLGINDQRVLVHHFAEGSFSHVLNSLIDLSKNDLIARMDADDICLPWRFDFQRREIARNPRALIFSSALVLFGERPLKVLVPQYPFRLSSSEVRTILPFTNPLNHPTLICSKSTILRLGGYRDVPGEDFELWLRAAEFGIDFLRTALPTIVYRISPGQMSRNPELILALEKDYSTTSRRNKLMSESLHEMRTLPIGNRLKLHLLILGFPTLAKFFAHRKRFFGLSASNKALDQ